jgi:hypothetical protein
MNSSFLSAYLIGAPLFIRLPVSAHTNLSHIGNGPTSSTSPDSNIVSSDSPEIFANSPTLNLPWRQHGARLRNSSSSRLPRLCSMERGADQPKKRFQPIRVRGPYSIVIVKDVTKTIPMLGVEYFDLCRTIRDDFVITRESRSSRDDVFERRSSKSGAMTTSGNIECCSWGASSMTWASTSAQTSERDCKSQTVDGGS